MSAKNAGDFRELIEKKESRRMDGAQKKNKGIIAWLGMFGIVGWSVTVPLLLGILLGKWLDRLFQGTHSFTLMFMFAGLCLGCANAWFWVRKALGRNEVRNSASAKAPADFAGVQSQGTEVRSSESGVRSQDKNISQKGPEEKNG